MGDDDGKINNTINSAELTFVSAELKTVSLCKTPLPYIVLMHTLPLFYPTPCMPSPYPIPAHAHSPPILSQPMHALPLFYPTPCMPSLYSVPAHPAILSPYYMHALSLFYPTLCMPSFYYFPPHTSHPSILFYSSPCMCSILLVIYNLKACFSFDIWVCHFWICSHWVYHHHLRSLAIWSINLWHQVQNVCCSHSPELTTWATH